MTKAEVIIKAFATIEDQNWNKADDYFSEDFIFTGAVSGPISKAEFELLYRAIQGGIPDLKFNLHDIRVEQDKVHAIVQLTGTHSNYLEIPIPGIDPIIASNREIKMPEEEIEFSFKKNLINKMHVSPVLNGGLSGLLHQLGVENFEKAKTI